MTLSRPATQWCHHTPEVRVVLHFCIPDLEDEVAATLDGLLADDGIQHSINVLRQILHQQRHTVLNA